MRRHFMVLPVILAGLASCTGRVMMTPLDPDTLDQSFRPKTGDPMPPAVPGIIVYRSRPLVEIDELMQGLDPKTGKPTDNCKHVLSRKFCDRG